jgi:hypothetical protein
VWLLTIQRGQGQEKLLPATRAFEPLPLGAVAPEGWLKQQLQIQADGLSGHLDEFWPDLDSTSAWRGGSGEGWERGPYYLDGLVPLAYLLQDQKLIAKTRPWMEWVLTHQRPDGGIGPEKNTDWWPNMLMLKVLTQYQEATGDARVVPLMEKYFAYQLRQMPANPLREWARYRWAEELLPLLWLYQRRQTLGLVNGVHNTDRALQAHGVNNAMALKMPTLWGLFSGRPADRNAIYQQLKVLDQYHLLPNGMHSGDEHYAGRDPSQGVELCAVVEAVFSYEQLVSLLGDPRFGDRLERVAFNALPATLSGDMWSHQYDQQPNQVLCSKQPRAWSTNGEEANLFGLEPHFGCCTANLHQGWPKFASHLWMATAQGGLVAAAYAPSTVRTTVEGVPVVLIEATDYPFREQVSLTVSPDRPVSFPLQLRIPGWAAGSSIRVNGKAVSGIKPGSFHTLNREWKRGDQVEIVFPMPVRVSGWVRQSVALERGPLLFALRIGEDWRKIKERDTQADDYEVHPLTGWNYGLLLDPTRLPTQVRVVEKPPGGNPFTAEGAPLQLRVKGFALPEWRLVDGSAGPLPPSPLPAGGPPQLLTLIPYGAAKLRITAFPYATEKNISPASRAR